MEGYTQRSCVQSWSEWQGTFLSKIIPSTVTETRNGLISLNQNLLENQCVFIRGFRVTRIAKIFPKLRAAAGPARIPDEDDPDPDMHLISIPTDTHVNGPFHIFQLLSDVSNYQDPLHTLLEYIGRVSVVDLPCCL